MQYLYTLRLIDQVTAPLQRVAQVGRQAYGSLSDGHRRWMAQQQEARSSTMGLGTAITGFLGLQAAKSIITLGANMEQTRMSFNTFLGDASKGAALLKDLNQFANVTPFDNAEVIQSGKVLLTAQVPAEKMLATLKTIGDVSAGINVPLNEMSSIYAKVMNKGRLQAEELNQLSERGVPIYAEMSKIFGVSTQEVMKLGEKGLITSAHMQQAFENMTSKGGMFEDMMKKQSETLGGRWSTFIGTVRDLGITIGEALIPVLNPLVDLLQSMAVFIDKNRGWLGPLIKVVAAGAIAYYAVTKAMLLYTAVTKGMTIKQWALNVAMTANPIGLIIAAIAAMIALAVIAINKFDEWGSAVLFLMGPFGMLINAFVIIKRNWDSIVDAFKGDGILGGLKRIGQVLLDTIMYPLQQILSTVGGWMGEDSWAAKGAKKLADFRKGWNLASSDAEKAASAGGVLGTGGGAKVDNTGKVLGEDPITKNNIAGITEGGSKQTNITISGIKLIENLTLRSENVREGAGQIRDILQEELLRVLNAANLVAHGS